MVSVYQPINPIAYTISSDDLICNLLLQSLIAFLKNFKTSLYSFVSSHVLKAPSIGSGASPKGPTANLSKYLSTSSPFLKVAQKW